MNALAIAIAPENVSLLAKTDELDDTGIEDKVLPVTEGASLRKMLMDEGADPNAAAAIQSALVANFSFDFRAGQKVRVGLATDPRPARSAPSASASTSQRPPHRDRRALRQRALCRGEGARLDGELEVAEQEAAADLPGTLPSLHDGLWGTGLSLDMKPGRDQEPRPHLLL